MKKIICALLICTVLVFCGCPYESRLPLSRSSESKIDSDLLGKWVWHDKDTDEKGYLWIYKFNNSEYLIEIYDVDEDEYMKFRGFGTIINGHKILNVSEVELEETTDVEYMFVKYEIIHDKMYYQTIEDRLIKGRFNSSEDLFNAILKHIENKELYSESTVLERSKEKSAE
jgi:hypothetical protein